MNKKDNFKFPFEQFHAQLEQIEKLYTSPLIDTVTQQQALLHSFAQPLAAFEKSVLPFEQFRVQSEKIGTLFSSPISEMARQQQNIYNSLVADTFLGFRESLGMLNIQPTFHNDHLTNTLKAIVTPLQEITSTYSRAYGVQFSELVQNATHSMLSDNFAPLIDSFLKNNYQEMTQKLFPSLKSLETIIDDIQVHEDSVDIPSELFLPQPAEQPSVSVSCFHKAKHVSASSTKQPHWLVQLILSAVISAAVATGFQQIANIPAQQLEQKWHEEEMEKLDQIIQLLSKKGPSTDLTTIMLLNMARPVTNWALANPTVLEQSDSMSSYANDAQSNADQVEPVPVSAEPTPAPTEPEPHPAESQPSTTPHSPDESEQPSESD